LHGRLRISAISGQDAPADKIEDVERCSDDNMIARDRGFNEMALDGISSASSRTKRPFTLVLSLSQQFPWCRCSGVETRGKYVRVRMTRLMAMRSKTDVPARIKRANPKRLTTVFLRLKRLSSSRAACSELPNPKRPRATSATTYGGIVPGHQRSGSWPES
jgi:hypothetical protein